MFLLQYQGYVQLPQFVLLLNKLYYPRLKSTLMELSAQLLCILGTARCHVDRFALTNMICLVTGTIFSPVMSDHQVFTAGACEPVFLAMEQNRAWSSSLPTTTSGQL